MSNDQVLLLVGVGVLSVGAMGVGLAAAWFSGRRYAEAVPQGDRPFRGATGQLEPPALEQEDDLSAPRRQVRERAIRIVALVFLAAVAAFVAISGRWTGSGDEPATAGAIYLLVGAGTLAVVFLLDLLPRSVPDGVRGWIEAGAAIAFLIVLTGLSDGLQSPFVVGFYLVVGAASLSRDGMAPLVLALIAGLGYGAIGLSIHWGEPVPDGALAFIGFQITALVLLAFIGTVAGREQRRAREAALRLARFDPLTGLYNRTHFFASMEREVRLSERAGRGFSLLMLDLDGLKPVNDTFGHHYGDRLLQAITEVIQRSVRTTDTPARYGGDEFVILLPDTDASGGFVVAEKLRRDVGALSIRVNERSVHTSVSIGLVAYPDDGGTVEELMAAVDAALYEAKRSGKDRIVGYTTRTERVATRMGTPWRDALTRDPMVPPEPVQEPVQDPTPPAAPEPTRAVAPEPVPSSSDDGAAHPPASISMPPAAPEPVPSSGDDGAAHPPASISMPSSGTNAEPVRVADADRRSVPSARARSPRVVRVERAPWETETQAVPPPAPAHAGPPVVPRNTSAPPVPRRMVALKVEGDVPDQARSATPGSPDQR